MIDLDKIEPQTTYIGFVINSYSGESLSCVKDAKCHLYDSMTHRDVCTFPLSGKNFRQTALVVCMLYRAGKDWWFHAVGEEADGKTAHENIDELQRFLQRNPLAKSKEQDATMLLR